MSSGNKPPEQLTSWKEIAERLGVAVRTAQTWEREKGLPVHRMQGDKGRVVADPLELDRWRQSVFHTNGWWSSLSYLRTGFIVSAALLLGAGAYIAIVHLTNSRTGTPAGFHVERTFLTVRDHAGRNLWTKVFPDMLASAAYADDALLRHRKIEFADIDGDGDLETLFVYSPLNSLRSPGALYCFSNSGEERWNFAPARTSPANGTGYGRTHVINDLLVTRPARSSEAHILLLDCRLPGHEADLFILSPRGETEAIYTHKGHLGRLATADVDGCGAMEVLMGGFAAERHEAELIVVELPGDQPRKTDSKAGRVRPHSPLIIHEKAILAFPRSCVNRKLEESNRIVQIVDSGEILTVIVSELSEDTAVNVTYELDRQLNVQAVWFSDALRTLHRTLEAQGILDHPLTASEVDSFKHIARLESHDPTDSKLD